jgi:DNA-directed RNA polymerase specialized sigma24 family protein
VKVGRPSRFSPDERRAWRILREAGWSYQRIAALFGCHHATVIYHVDASYRKRKDERRRGEAA